MDAKDTTAPNTHILSSNSIPFPEETQTDSCQWRRKKKKREEILENTLCFQMDYNCSFNVLQPTDGYSFSWNTPSDISNTQNRDTCSLSPEYKDRKSTDMSSEVIDSNWDLLTASENGQNHENVCSRMWDFNDGTCNVLRDQPELYTPRGRRISTKNKKQLGLNFMHFLLCAFIFIGYITSLASANDDGDNLQQNFTTTAPFTSIASNFSNFNATNNLDPATTDTSFPENTNTDLPTDQTLPDFNLDSDFSSSFTVPSTTNNNKTDILLGYITTLTYPQNVELAAGRKISGAMTHAVNVVNNDPAILPNHRLRYLLGDNEGTELNSLKVLTYQWENGARAFFGPEDSCEVESRIAAAWEIPILAYKCDSPVVSDKERFPTLARTQPPATHSVTSVIALMKSYNWAKFSIIVEKIDLMPRAGLSLQSLAHANNMTINHFVNITGPYSPVIHAKELQKAIQDTYKTTRIYVIYSRTTLFLDAVRYMYDLGLTNSNKYVVIGVRDDEPYEKSMSESLMFYPSEFEQDRSNESVPAFQDVLLLVGLPIANPDYTSWESAVRELLYEPPINLEKNALDDILGIKVHIPVFAAYLYDSVLLYARALHEVLLAGGTAEDGALVFDKMRDRTFLSVQGHEVYIDHNGDAEANFTVLALRPTNNQFGQGLLPVGRFSRSPFDRQNVTYVIDVDIYGVNIPLDEPVCGYNGELCLEEASLLAYIVGGCLGGIGLILIIVLSVLYRNWRYEQELASLIWKIDTREIQLQPDAAISALSMISNNGPQSTNVSLSLGPDQEQRFTKMGVYRGTLVALKAIKKKSIDTSSREIKLELKQMRDLRHDNIVQFIGATIDVNATHLVTEYCSKGSLEDILENSDLKLDDMFIASIISDILKGMNYIHSTALISHGNLKSSNCLVDSRWVVKMSDFGLNKFKAKQEMPYHGEHANYKRFLWTAPELLRMEKPPLGGTQKGDVFSFAVLLYEILNRNGPYGDCHLTPKEIVERVKEGPSQGIPFRPSTAELNCESYFLDTLTRCWHEDPDLRPDFKTCRKDLRPMQKGMRSNIFDNMMMLMEKYANNLESVVAERTVELHEEKKKTETLLYRMLPTSVAAQLVRGQSVIPEAFDNVTIYFSDICGFTAMSSESTPLQIVDMLNDLYTLFDGIIKDYDVYKVETIGDAYMVVSGLPKRNGNNHAGEIASMSLSLLSAIKQFKIRHRPDDILKLRIGIHTGSCVAGVVGQTMPRYCLFGDTVNTASRMESNGEALRIHVSPNCKAVLDELGGYTLLERGLVHMKGKGEVRTYWLEDEDVTIREKRARNSDDSGVNTDGPTELSQNNAILIHKQRALQHQQQQQLQLHFGRPESGNNLRSSLRLSFKQQHRNTGDSRSLTGFIGALSGGGGGGGGSGTCASPGGSSGGGSMVPRRSRSARGYRYNRGDAETISTVSARSVSQMFGNYLGGGHQAVNPSFIVSDETSKHLQAMASVIAGRSDSTGSTSFQPATFPISAGVTLQVPDLLTKTPEAEARESLEKRATSDAPHRYQNPPISSSIYNTSHFAPLSHGEHDNKSPGSITNGLLGGSALGGHEYTGHPAVKTGLWVDKHAEFHRQNTEPALPRARNRAALYATTARTIKAVNSTSTTISDSVMASCKACNSGRSTGKKKHKCNHQNHSISGSTNSNGHGESSAGRTFSTHSPVRTRREPAPEPPVPNTKVKTPENIGNLHLNVGIPSTSNTDNSESEKSPKEESFKGKEKTFNLHIFNMRKAKSKDKQLNFSSNTAYESEIPEGVEGNFTPTRISPDSKVPASQKNKIHPLLLAAQADIACECQMEDCPSPSRHSVTFSEDTVL